MARWNPYRLDRCRESTVYSCLARRVTFSHIQPRSVAACHGSVAINQQLWLHWYHNKIKYIVLMYLLAIEVQTPSCRQSVRLLYSWTLSQTAPNVHSIQQDHGYRKHSSTSSCRQATVLSPTNFSVLYRQGERASPRQPRKTSHLLQRRWLSQPHRSSTTHHMVARSHTRRATARLRHQQKLPKTRKKAREHNCARSPGSRDVHEPPRSRAAL